MLLIDVSKLILLLKKHSKRLIKIQLLSDFILNHSFDDSMLLFDILCGNYSREISKKELGISLKTVLNALSIWYEIPQKTIEKEFFKHGDIFELISTIDTQKNSIRNKISTTQTQLILKDVTQALVKISNTSGKNSNTSKINIILSLLSNTQTVEERLFLGAFLSDLLKIGVNEGVLLDTFLFSYFPKLNELHHKDKTNNKWFISKDIIEEITTFSYSFSTIKTIEDNKSNNVEYTTIEEFIKYLIIDLGKKKTTSNAFPLTHITLTSTSKSSREIQLEFKELVEKVYSFNVSFQITFQKLQEDLQHLIQPPIIFKKPIQVMLGPRLYSFEEVEEKISFPIFSDYKYDGLRLIVQNHFGEVTLFSRNLENLTSQFHEVVTFVKENFSTLSCVLDCECLGYQKESHKNPYIQVPFQELSKRIMTKSHNLKSTIFVGARFFDILELNGELLYELPFKKRIKKLQELFIQKKLTFSKHNTKSQIINALENYFRR